MQASVRKALDDLARGGPLPSSNAALWLDRYLCVEGDVEPAQAKQQHLTKTRIIGLPEGYEDFFERHKAALQRDPRTRLFEASVIGRLALGLGRASSWENGITLHHTWGVPFIPGSALKGLASSYAHQRLAEPNWRKAGNDGVAGESHELLFGTTAVQGAVVFHDALFMPRPSKAGALGLAPDTVTVHHRDYYQPSSEREISPPADWDSPVPIPFLSLTGEFLLALSGPPAWVDAAVTLMQRALEELGIGAKTSSGYGRLRCEEILSERARGRKELPRAAEQVRLPRGKGELNQLTGFVTDVARQAETAPTGVQEAVTVLAQRIQLEPKDRRKMFLDHLAKLGGASEDERVRQIAEQVLGRSREREDLPAETTPGAGGSPRARDAALALLESCDSAKKVRKTVVRRYFSSSGANHRDLDEQAKRELARRIRSWLEDKGELEELGTMRDLTPYLGES